MTTEAAVLLGKGVAVSESLQVLKVEYFNLNCYIFIYTHTLCAFKAVLCVYIIADCNTYLHLLSFLL